MRSGIKLTLAFAVLVVGNYWLNQVPQPTGVVKVRQPGRVNGFVQHKEPIREPDSVDRVNQAWLLFCDKVADVPEGTICDKQAREFFEVVEKELDVKVPRNWTLAFAKKYYIERTGRAVFKMEKDFSPPFRTEVTETTIFVDSEDAVYRVPKRLCTTLTQFGSVLSDSYGFCVAVHGWPPRPFTLFSISSDESVRWCTEVLAMNALYDYVGNGRHVVDITRSGDKDIVVFGNSHDGVYIEKFNANNGKRVFRFGSHDCYRRSGAD